MKLRLKRLRHLVVVALAGAALVWAALAGGDFAVAQDRPSVGDEGTVTGLPLPRYVSVRADEVNVRTGPGVRYPIDWVFVREDMPVEVVAEFETWRQIRDWQGVTGWVHRSMLSGKRTVLVAPEMVTLRREADAASPPVARAEHGVVGELEACQGDWCRVSVGDVEGWSRRVDLWGATPGEGPLDVGKLSPALEVRPAAGPDVALPTPAGNN